jgi:hypothetical protein
VTNEKGPPDNERQEYGHRSPYQRVLTINRPTPAEPVWGKQTQAYGDKIFLEVKVTQRMPMAIAFQVGLNIDLEIQVDDRTEQRGDQIPHQARPQRPSHAE